MHIKSLGSFIKEVFPGNLTNVSISFKESRYSMTSLYRPRSLELNYSKMVVLYFDRKPTKSYTTSAKEKGPRNLRLIFHI